MRSEREIVDDLKGMSRRNVSTVQEFLRMRLQKQDIENRILPPDMIQRGQGKAEELDLVIRELERICLT